MKLTCKLMLQKWEDCYAYCRNESQYLKNAEEVPTAELEHEQAVLAEQARNEGKPEKIIEKMVAGRIEKYYKEVCLMEHTPLKIDKSLALQFTMPNQFTQNR